MDETPSADNRAAEPGTATRALRPHIWAYVLVNGALFLINLLIGGGWWVFWPIFVWGIALSAHWFYVKSINVDEQWVEERTFDIRHGAYDLGHIEDIEKRHEKAGGHNRPPNRQDDGTAGRN